MPAAKRRRPAPEPVTVRRPDAEVWRQALLLAASDVRRIEVRADGSVVVRNKQIR